MKSGKIVLILFLSYAILLAFVSAAWAGDIELHQDSSGRIVDMAKGQSLCIALPSNPSTGYGWLFTGEPDPGVLIQLGKDFRPDSSGLVGEGGTEYLRFQAVGAGSTTIHLGYERPWETVSPAKTFSVQIMVANSMSQAASSLVFGIGTPYYTLNGKTSGTRMEVAPFISQNRVFVPARLLANVMGLTECVTWNQSTQTVALRGAVTTVQMTIGQASLTVNDKTKSIDVAPLLIQGRSYLPVRWVAESLGYQVTWNDKNRVVGCWQ